jgi:pimeloyl-ACP methyl ester carboxylesterase
MPKRPAPPPSQAVVEHQRELSIAGVDGVTLSGEEAGEGPAIVLLHGLTASRRYVLHGSRALERSGFRVIAYDARGHGRSTPASGPRAYAYEQLAGDLSAVLDATGVERVLLAGVSMGSQTIVRFALEHPERVAALAIITPAYDPTLARGDVDISGWDALARGLREGGIEGFLAAYDLEPVAPSLRETVQTVVRQRLAAHLHPGAVADALEAVPRSRPFEALEALESIAVPTLLVASRDEADPGHPYAVAQSWAERIPGARLVSEQETTPPRSPIAWQGGQLSRLIAETARQVRT